MPLWVYKKGTPNRRYGRGVSKIPDGPKLFHMIPDDLRRFRMASDWPDGPRCSQMAPAWCLVCLLELLIVNLGSSKCCFGKFQVGHVGAFTVHVFWTKDYLTISKKKDQALLGRARTLTRIWILKTCITHKPGNHKKRLKNRLIMQFIFSSLTVIVMAWCLRSFRKQCISELSMGMSPQNLSAPQTHIFGIRVHSEATSLQSSYTFRRIQR